MRSYNKKKKTDKSNFSQANNDVSHPFEPTPFSVEPKSDRTSSIDPHTQLQAARQSKFNFGKIPLRAPTENRNASKIQMMPISFPPKRLSGNDQVIQRLMTTDQWQAKTPNKWHSRGTHHNPELVTIDNYLTNYHKKNDKNDPNLEDRLQILTNIETTIYSWYNRRFNVDSNDEITSTRLEPMYDLLDDVAEEQGLLINRTIDEGLDLPISKVGNNEVEKDSNEYQAIQSMWQDLVNETGNVNFVNFSGSSNDQVDPEFKKKVLPYFAKLLRTPKGRQLVEALLTLRPQDMNVDDDKGTVTVLPQIGSKAKQGGVGSAGVKKFGPEQPGGKGIGSKLRIDSSAKESKPSRIGAGKDTRGRELFSPMLIVLAHEMIHVIHNVKGQNRNKTGLDHWDNEEEKVTISGKDKLGNIVSDLSEQSLRDEYGLEQERFGH